MWPGDTDTVMNQFDYYFALELAQLARTSNIPSSSVMTNSFHNSSNPALMARQLEDQLSATDLKKHLKRVIWKMTKFHFLLACACQFWAILLGFVGPVALNSIISYVNDPTSAPFWQENGRYGLFLGGCMFLASVARSLLQQQSQFLCMREGLRARVTVVSLVFRKSMLLTTHSLLAYTQGSLSLFSTLF